MWGTSSHEPSALAHRFAPLPQLQHTNGYTEAEQFAMQDDAGLGTTSFDAKATV